MRIGPGLVVGACFGAVIGSLLIGHLAVGAVIWVLVALGIAVIEHIEGGFIK